MASKSLSRACRWVGKWVALRLLVLHTRAPLLTCLPTRQPVPNAPSCGRFWTGPDNQRRSVRTDDSDAVFRLDHPFRVRVVHLADGFLALHSDERQRSQVERLRLQAVDVQHLTALDAGITLEGNPCQAVLGDVAYHTLGRGFGLGRRLGLRFCEPVLQLLEGLVEVLDRLGLVAAGFPELIQGDRKSVV